MTEKKVFILQKTVLARMLISVLVVAPCIISMAAGNAENVMTAEGLSAIINLLLVVVLLAGFLFSSNHTLAFVHVTAIWLILIFAQFWKYPSSVLIWS